MKEYKIAKFWAIFIYITAPFLFGLFIWVLLLPFIEGDFEIEKFLMLTPVSLAMLTLIVVGVLDTIYGKIIVDNDSISLKSPFINRTLKFDEIKGYRVDNNSLIVLPNSKKKKRLNISLYIGESDELIDWMGGKFNILS